MQDRPKAEPVGFAHPTPRPIDTSSRIQRENAVAMVAITPILESKERPTKAPDIAERHWTDSAPDVPGLR